MVNPVGP
jgi:hypothetical protein